MSSSLVASMYSDLNEIFPILHFAFGIIRFMPWDEKQKLFESMLVALTISLTLTAIGSSEAGNRYAVLSLSPSFSFFLSFSFSLLIKSYTRISFVTLAAALRRTMHAEVQPHLDSRERPRIQGGLRERERRVQCEGSRSPPSLKWISPDTNDPSWALVFLLVSLCILVSAKLITEELSMSERYINVQYILHLYICD